MHVIGVLLYWVVRFFHFASLEQGTPREGEKMDESAFINTR